MKDQDQNCSFFDTIFLCKLRIFFLYFQKALIKLTFQKRLSSVIKTSERKYNIPKSMQPNKAILLNAVDAANLSVKTVTKPKSIADERLGEIRAKRFARLSNPEPAATKTHASDEQRWVIE